MAVVEARGGHYGEMGLSYDKFIKGVQHRLLCKFILTASHDVNPIINNIQRDKVHKKREYCFESKCLRDKTNKHRRQLTAAK